MKTLNTWNKLLTAKEAEYTVLQTGIREKEQHLQTTVAEHETKLEAQTIIQTAAEITQSTLEGQLGDIVSMALAAVFEDPYKFVVNFVQRRNTTECDIMFEREGETMDPLSDSGFGAADIASSALRVSYWASGETSPFIMVDEPCKNLSKSYHALAATMFKELSKELGLQMLIVTHIPEFRDAADKLFMVTQNRKGVSSVR